MSTSRRKPLLVMAAEFWTGSTGAGIADGLRRLGWLVHEIDIRNFTGQPGDTTFGKIAFRLQKRTALSAFRNRIIGDCETLRPDVFLTVKGTEISVEMLDRIRDLGIRAVNYYPDYHFDYANFDQTTIARYDDFITTKAFQLDYLHAIDGPMRAHFVPHGYAGLVHRRVYPTLVETDYRRDVGYAGNHSPAKAGILGTLRRLRPDLDLAITGPNWGNLHGHDNLRPCIDGRDRRNLAFSEFLQLSRINLAFHYGKAANGWDDAVSTRSFEIPACGGFMLHIDNAEIREYYDVGSEIDVFSSPEDLADKVDFYLVRPDLRKAMIAKAYARAVPAYSYATRASELLAALGLDAGFEQGRA